MISFIYFDVGGVAIKDFTGNSKWDEFRKDLGVKKEDFPLFDSVWEKNDSRLGIDRDVDSLIPILNKELGINFDKNYSMLNDFVDRFEKNPSIWPVIEKAQQNHKVGLLTNMYPRMFDAIVNKNLLPPTHINIVVDSSVVGYQKPDEKIYTIAEEKAGSDPSEILFVDNLQENVDVAISRGWRGFYYDSGDMEKSSADLMQYLTNHWTYATI